MKINMPEKVTYIITELMNHGYEAYAVGGCVRDSILGREPGDWDITTSASPMEVKEIFRRTIDTGIQHGTVTVMIDKEGFEVTTYRLDGEYEDNRHPKQVEFTKSLEEDLKRRDFTINAMAYNNVSGIVDLFSGQKDIVNKIIRCVGSPRERFEEDALRILRALRFSAQLGFSIESSTREAIIEKSPNLCAISAERIREELNKLLLSAHPMQIEEVYKMGISKYILKELDELMADQAKCYAGSTKNFVLKQLQQCCIEQHNQRTMLIPKERVFEHRVFTDKERLALSYAVLLSTYTLENQQYKVLHQSDTTELREKTEFEEWEKKAKTVMRRLRFDNETTDLVGKLIKFQMITVEDDEVAVRKAMNLMGIDLFDYWYFMKWIHAKIEQELLGMSNLKQLERVYEHYKDIIEKKECVDLKGLAFNGKALIAMGVKPGKQLGELLGQLLEHVIVHPEDNTSETLMEIVEKRIDC